MNPQPIEITNDDLIMALAQKELQIIGLNKRIAELQLLLSKLQIEPVDNGKITAAEKAQ